MTASSVERPRDLNALINETIAGYQRGFPVLVIVSALAAIPGLLQAIIAGPSTARLNSLGQHAASASDVGSLYTSVFTSPGFIIGTGLAGLIAILAAPFLYAAPYAAAVAIVEGQPVTFNSVLAACAARYASLWGLLAIVFLVLVGLTVTCIGIPFAIYIGIRWALALPAFFAEDRGTMAALGTSWEIVRNNWWRTFGLLLLVGIAVGVVSAIVGGIVGVVTLVLPEAVRLIVQAVVSGAITAFLGPIFTLFATLLYFDLRARRMAAATA